MHLRKNQKIFDLFVQAGGNFIDTANVYQNGTSEKYVGKFIAPELDKFVLAIIYTCTTNPIEEVMRSFPGSFHW
jgi:aryl-alcohol dehydrogenase-like predicted oxidoreductase